MRFNNFYLFSLLFVFVFFTQLWITLSIFLEKNKKKASRLNQQNIRNKCLVYYLLSVPSKTEPNVSLPWTSCSSWTPGFVGPLKHLGGGSSKVLKTLATLCKKKKVDMFGLSAALRCRCRLVTTVGSVPGRWSPAPHVCPVSVWVCSFTHVAACESKWRTCGHSRCGFIWISVCVCVCKV